MKQYIAGVISGLILFLIICDGVIYLSDKYPTNPQIEKIQFLFMQPSLGLVDILEGHCTNGSGVSPQGWVVDNFRRFYGCNKIQIALSDILGVK